jgi:hypothetical protein
VAGGADASTTGLLVSALPDPDVLAQRIARLRALKDDAIPNAYHELSKDHQQQLAPYWELLQHRLNVVVDAYLSNLASGDWAFAKKVPGMAEAWFKAAARFRTIGWAAGGMGNFGHVQQARDALSKEDTEWFLQFDFERIVHAERDSSDAFVNSWAVMSRGEYERARGGSDGSKRDDYTLPRNAGRADLVAPTQPSTNGSSPDSAARPITLTPINLTPLGPIAIPTFPMPVVTLPGWPPDNLVGVKAMTNNPGVEFASVGFGQQATPQNTQSTPAHSAPYEWSGVAGPAYSDLLSYQTGAAQKMVELCGKVASALDGLRSAAIDYLLSLNAAVLAYETFVKTAHATMLQLRTGLWSAIKNLVNLLLDALGGNVLGAIESTGDVLVAQQSRGPIETSLALSFQNYWNATGGWVKNYASFVAAQARYIMDIRGVLAEMSTDVNFWAGGDYNASVDPTHARVAGGAPVTVQWYNWTKKIYGGGDASPLPYVTTKAEGGIQLVSPEGTDDSPQGSPDLQAAQAAERAYQTRQATEAELRKQWVARWTREDTGGQ